MKHSSSLTFKALDSRSIIMILLALAVLVLSFVDLESMGNHHSGISDDVDSMQSMK